MSHLKSPWSMVKLIVGVSVRSGSPDCAAINCTCNWCYKFEVCCDSWLHSSGGFSILRKKPRIALKYSWLWLTEWRGDWKPNILVDWLRCGIKKAGALACWTCKLLSMFRHPVLPTLGMCWISLWTFRANCQSIRFLVGWVFCFGLWEYPWQF